VRPGPVGRRGLVDAILPRNFVHRPAGENPARPRVSPPSDADVAGVVQKISRRVIRTLRRLGYLEAAMEVPVATGYDPLLDTAPEFARTMAASVRQRIAFRERAGENVRRIGSGFGYEGERPELIGYVQTAQSRATPRCESLRPAAAACRGRRHCRGRKAAPGAGTGRSRGRFPGLRSGRGGTQMAFVLPIRNPYAGASQGTPVVPAVPAYHRH
jgi:hypothetical protein